MNDNHLSDQDIQAVALDAKGKESALHIASCIQCRTEVEKYRMLFSAMKTLENPVFDFKLADLVLSKLPASRPKPSEKYLYAFITLFLVILVLGLGYCIGIDRVIRVLSGNASMLIYLVIITFTGILLFQALDTLRSYHKKMKALNGY